MSTQKALLLRDNLNGLKKLKSKIDDYDGLLFPIGILVEQPELGYMSGGFTFGCKQHMFLGGATGSGKTVTVTSCILSVLLLYGEQVKISYVDGKDCEVRQWLHDGECIFPNHGFVGGVRDVESFMNAIDSIIASLESKKLEDKELIVIDDAWGIIEKMSKYECDKLLKLFDFADSKNAHVIFSMQAHLGVLYCSNDKPYGDIGKAIMEWEWIALTRVSRDVAIALQGLPDADHKLRNGRLFVKRKWLDEVIEYKVPYAGLHEVKDFAELAKEVDS